MVGVRVRLVVASSAPSISSCPWGIDTLFLGILFLKNIDHHSKLVKMYNLYTDSASKKVNDDSFILVCITTQK
jgi:hypothetical protein